MDDTQKEIDRLLHDAFIPEDEQWSEQKIRQFIDFINWDFFYFAPYSKEFVRQYRDKMEYFKLSHAPVEDILLNRLGGKFFKEIYGKEKFDKAAEQVMQRMLIAFRKNRSDKS